MKKIPLLFLAMLFCCLNVFSQNPGEVYFEETFTNGGVEGKWTAVIGNDNDPQYGWQFVGIGVGDGDNSSVFSSSWDPDTGEGIEPDHWLISPVIDRLVNVDASKKIILNYFVGSLYSNDPYETYQIYFKYVDTEEDEDDEIVDLDEYLNNTLGAGIVEVGGSFLQTSLVLSDALKGRKFRLAFRHHPFSSSPDPNGLFLDNVTIKDAVENAQLEVEWIYPNGTYNMGTELTVGFNVYNSGLTDATGVTASYYIDDILIATENFNNIPSLTSSIQYFETKINPITELREDIPLRVIVSATNAVSVTKSSTFTVYPPHILANWNFEDYAKFNSLPEAQKELEKNFKLVTADEFMVAEAITERGFFPNNEAWTVAKMGDTSQDDYPEYLLGSVFLVTTGCFELEDSSVADRWIIFPQMYLDGQNILMAWNSGSSIMADIGFAEPEVYEVLISEKGTDLEDFEVIHETTREFGTIVSPATYVKNLSEYAGKHVYIAFRNVKSSTVNLLASPSLLLVDNVRLFTDNPALGTESGNKINTIEFKVYPNPVQNTLTIDAEDLESCEIVNYLGQTVYSERFTDDAYEVKLDNLPKGLYIVKVKSIDGKIASQKISKQ